MAKILVIDDEQSVRRAVTRVLEREGHQVEAAGDGRAALSLIGRLRPDLVISDLFMPEMDGVELIRSLRRDFPKIKVVAISGGAFQGQVQMLDVAEGLGAVAVLKKPFELEDLLGVVNQVLGEQQ